MDHIPYSIISPIHSARSESNWHVNTLPVFIDSMAPRPHTTTGGGFPDPLRPVPNGHPAPMGQEAWMAASQGVLPRSGANHQAPCYSLTASYQPGKGSPSAYMYSRPYDPPVLQPPSPGSRIAMGPPLSPPLKRTENIMEWNAVMGILESYHVHL